MNPETDRSLSTGGIILAGGKSSRFGTDKGLALFRGKPLISWSLNALVPLVDEILIISSNREYEKFGYRVIPDIIPGLGPLGGILTGLKSASHHLNFVVSCDTPMISTELLSYLQIHANGYEALVPLNVSNQYEPLCAICSKSCVPAIEKMTESGSHKVLDLYERVNTRSIRIDQHLPFYNDFIFMNINTLDDI